MADKLGFEPRTFALTARRIYLLSYLSKYEIGECSRNRT